ncbi:MAG: cryptochrome/photolyase family protein, partial [Flavobacteriales bacterium]
MQKDQGGMNWNEVIAECQDAQPADEVALICGDQLNEHHSSITGGPVPTRLFVMMEIRTETDYARHHIQKVVAFFGAMRLFAQRLHERGHRVHYIALDDPDNAQSFAANIHNVAEKVGARRFCWQQPDEFRLDEALKALAAECEANGVQTECTDTEHFYTHRTELADFFKGKKTYRLENFYRAMRAKHDVLMDAVGQPEGGQWNFDTNNRQKLPKDHVIPPPKLYHRDVASLQAMLEAAGVETTGQLNPASWGWPLTREEGLDLLGYFVDELLPHFGDYQDALTPESWSVYHSRLSFVMNTKLLSPDEVNRAVEKAWRSNPERVSISQVEGFIRQILGWREYVRGLYFARMPDHLD